MRRITTSAVLAAAFLGIVVGSVSAAETVIAKVPFPFVVRGQEFKAGRYQVSTEDGLLTVRGMDNSGRAVALTMPEDGRDPAGNQPALVFILDENQYLLSQIWQSRSDGREVLEKSNVPHHASAASAAPIVVVAAGLK